MSVTYDRLARFMIDELALPEAEVSADALLFSSGVIDSFSLVSLLTYLETEGGVLIDPADVNLENFDSINRMLRYVERVAA
jgi:acyl carrier protein